MESVRGDLPTLRVHVRSPFEYVRTSPAAFAATAAFTSARMNSAQGFCANVSPGATFTVDRNARS